MLKQRDVIIGALLLLPVLAFLAVTPASMQGVRRELMLMKNEAHGRGVALHNWMAHIKQERESIIAANEYPSDVCRASMMFRPSAQCRDFDRVGDAVSSAASLFTYSLWIEVFTNIEYNT